MSDLKVEILPPDSGLVPVTQDEAWAWMLVAGRVTTVERDGRLYRVLEPWEGVAPDMPQERCQPA